MEKRKINNELPLPVPIHARNRTSSFVMKLVIALSASLFIYAAFPSFYYVAYGGKHDLVCPAQPDPLVPNYSIEWTLESRRQSIERFQAAIQIPTQSYDDNGDPEEDERWAPFKDFQNWMKDTFPTAWNAANVEFINSELSRRWTDRSSRHCRYVPGIG